MQKVITIISIIALFSLGGCSGSNVAQLVTLPTGEIVSAATNRFGSWERVEIAKSAERAAATNLELAKLEFSKSSEPQVVITIDSVEAMESYERSKSVDALAKANDMLGKVAVSLAEKDKPAVSNTTPFPKGAFAEGFESFGKGIKDVGNTPATVILSTGYALGSFMDAVDQGADVDSGGGDVSIATDKNQFTASGDSASVTSQPDQDNSTVSGVE